MYSYVYFYDLKFYFKKKMHLLTWKVIYSFFQQIFTRNLLCVNKPYQNIRDVISEEYWPKSLPSWSLCFSGKEKKYFSKYGKW